MSSCSITEEGQVTGVSYHDGRILSIIFSANGEIVLTIEGVEGARAEISLVGVRYLVVDGMREGNLIDSIFLWDWSLAPDVEKRRLYEGIGFDASIRGRDVPNIAAKLFRIICSFGADLVANVDGARIKSIQIADSPSVDAR